jgi:glutamate-1-semialdehyde 2,1-aminomutase
MEKAKGSRIFDCDGNEFIDYMMGGGPVILGHANAAVNQAVREQLEMGTIFGAGHEAEIKVSEKLARHVPCAEMSSILTTGSDATLGALRLARAYTAKEKVVKFDGHYHSWHDWHKFDGFRAGHLISGGIPHSIENDYLVLPWNEPEALDILGKRGHEIAAVICEPVIGNCACIAPVKGYLEELRAVCTKNQIVLIFDEIVTGFRLGLGGAQKMLGVTPDLATFAKSIGNGFPIAAIAGRKEIMMSNALLGGTYNSNPVSCAAALATISELEDEENYRKMKDVGRTLLRGIRDAIKDTGIEATVQGYETLFSIIFTDKDRIRFPHELQSVAFHPHIRRAAAFYQALVDRGVYNRATRGERWCLSTAHERDDIDKTLGAMTEAFREARKIA